MTRGRLWFCATISGSAAHQSITTVRYCTVRYGITSLPLLYRTRTVRFVPGVGPLESGSSSGSTVSGSAQGLRLPAGGRTSREGAGRAAGLASEARGGGLTHSRCMRGCPGHRPGRGCLLDGSISRSSMDGRRPRDLHETRRFIRGDLQQYRTVRYRLYECSSSRRE